MGRVTVLGIASLALAALVVPVTRAADVEAPVFGRQTPPGMGTVLDLPAREPATKTVDGRVDDWIGDTPGYAGATQLSAGELVYQDHLFDAWGADDGRDAQRLGTLDPLQDAVPETYRLDPLYQADVPGELGVDTDGTPLDG